MESPRWFAQSRRSSTHRLGLLFPSHCVSDLVLTETEKSGIAKKAGAGPILGTALRLPVQAAPHHPPTRLVGPLRPPSRGIRRSAKQDRHTA
jgi:hypothetical protein